MEVADASSSSAILNANWTLYFVFYTMPSEKIIFSFSFWFIIGVKISKNNPNEERTLFCYLLLNKILVSGNVPETSILKRKHQRCPQICSRIWGIRRPVAAGSHSFAGANAKILRQSRSSRPGVWKFAFVLRRFQVRNCFSPFKKVWILGCTKAVNYDYITIATDRFGQSQDWNLIVAMTNRLGNTFICTPSIKNLHEVRIQNVSYK